MERSMQIPPFSAETRPHSTGSIYYNTEREKEQTLQNIHEKYYKVDERFNKIKRKIIVLKKDFCYTMDTIVCRICNIRPAKGAAR
ncbi:hypothetical protein [Gemmiger sp. An194]|uniref:hypothetical protein n=1 Tax=Gemmiger sp. An194 TaxID=1965582 RepID=UPI00130280AA|nr:hypothetical protein [Gemmiger sp. An194]